MIFDIHSTSSPQETIDFLRLARTMGKAVFYLFVLFLSLPNLYRL